MLTTVPTTIAVESFNGESVLSNRFIQLLERRRVSGHLYDRRPRELSTEAHGGVVKNSECISPEEYLVSLGVSAGRTLALCGAAAEESYTPEVCGQPGKLREDR